MYCKRGLRKTMVFLTTKKSLNSYQNKLSVGRAGRVMLREIFHTKLLVKCLLGLDLNWKNKNS